MRRNRCPISPSFCASRRLAAVSRLTAYGRSRPVFRPAPAFSASASIRGSGVRAGSRVMHRRAFICCRGSRSSGGASRRPSKMRCIT